MLSRPIIIKPINSPKAQFLSANQRCKTKIFLVDKKATKAEIKASMLQLFKKITVLDIRTVNMPAKKVNFKGRPGLIPSYKKAYITLGEGFDIRLK